MNKVMDCVSNFDNLLVKSSDLLMEGVDNVFLFFVNWSWFRMIWSWSWSSLSMDNDSVNSMSDSSNPLLQHMNSVNQSVNSFGNNRWSFWFWFWVDMTFSNNSSWSSSDDSDLWNDMSDSLSDMDNSFPDVNDLFLKNGNLMLKRCMLFWLDCWKSSNNSNNMMSNSSDLSNQFPNDVSFVNNSMSQLSQLNSCLLWMKTREIWSDKSSDLSVDNSQRSGTLFSHSSLEGITSLVTSLSLGSQSSAWGSAVFLLKSKTFEALDTSGLLDLITNLGDSSLFFNQSFESSSLDLGVSTRVYRFHECWSMDEDMELMNVFLDVDSLNLNLMNDLFQCSSQDNNLLSDEFSLCNSNLMDLNSQNSDLLSDDMDLVNQFSDDSFMVDNNLSDLSDL